MSNIIAIALHRTDVQKGCAFFANKLIEAGIGHDNSKIPLIDDYMQDIATKTGSEFKAGKWYQAHINQERHHLYEKCPDDVTLIDVMEQLIDCVMAAMARKGNVSGDFGISDEIMQKAYKNTVELLKKEIILEND